MEEPMDLGSDGSLAADVSGLVQSIMERAEREASATVRQADADCARRLDAARDDASALRESAARDASHLAAAQIERILAVRRAITSDALALAQLARDGDAARQRLAELADALSERADRIAREAHISLEGADRAEAADRIAREAHISLEGAARAEAAERTAPDADAESEGAGASRSESESAGNLTSHRNGVDEADAPVDGTDAGSSDPPRRRRFVRALRGGAKARGGNPPSKDVLRWARLAALQMAVAGESREEAEGRLLERFDIPDPAIVLDDVFGTRT